MRIREFVWPQDRIDHIARHGVLPSEVEEVCFGQPWILRTTSKGDDAVYQFWGQTEAGRYLFCVVRRLPDGNAYPVTARPMDDREKRRYRQRRRR
jgi:uncharacterized protein